MSIRIHKALGWGLENVKDMEDPRVNWDSPYLQGRSHKHTRHHYYDYLETLREGADRWSDPVGEMAMMRANESQPYLHNGGRLEDPKDCVHYDFDDETHLSTFLIRPIADPDYYRVDDTLDWVQDEMIDDLGLEQRTQRLWSNPWPRDATWMNAHTGERLTNQDGLLMTWVRASQAALPPERRRPCEGALFQALELIAHEMGFSSIEEAEETVVPNVPWDIRNLVEFGQLFTNSRTVLELRPMLLTYWC